MKPAKIKNCDAVDCVYNQQGKCHAISITVGGNNDHMCDTFCPSRSKGGIASAVGIVGACKVTECLYNKDFECGADSVEIGHWGKTVDCLSYRKK